MWKVQEILEQLEFERKRHMKMSGLVEDFDISMEHLEAAGKVEQAIEIIKCSLDCAKAENSPLPAGTGKGEDSICCD